MNQLEKDRDVIAQYEAVQALRIFNTSQNALTKLEHILYDKCLYYRIRIEAAYSIAMVSPIIEEVVICLVFTTPSENEST